MCPIIRNCHTMRHHICTHVCLPLIHPNHLGDKNNRRITDSVSTEFKYPKLWPGKRSFFRAFKSVYLFIINCCVSMSRNCLILLFLYSHTQVLSYLFKFKYRNIIFRKKLGYYKLELKELIIFAFLSYSHGLNNKYTALFFT